MRTRRRESDHGAGNLIPRTGREGLLILRLLVEEQGPLELGDHLADRFRKTIDEALLDGNLEELDRLADRFAGLWQTLEQISRDGFDPAGQDTLQDQVAAVLALPPDLEAMVNRRAPEALEAIRSGAHSRT